MNNFKRAVSATTCIAVAVVGLLTIMPAIAGNATTTTYYWNFTNCAVTPHVVTTSTGSYDADSTYWENPSFNATTGVAKMKIQLAGIPLMGATIVTQIDVKGNSFTATSTKQLVQYVWHLSVDAYIKSTDTNAYSQVSVVGRLYESDGSEFASPVGMTWGVKSNADGYLVTDELNAFYTLNATFSGLSVGQVYTLDTMLEATVHVPSMQSGYPYGYINMNLGEGSETGLLCEVVT